MKKLMILLVLAASLLTISVAFAAEKNTMAAQDTTATEDSGHAAMQAKMAKMEGKDIYKSMCKACHGPDADAGEYTPMSLIMDQWDEFFADTFAESHKDVVCPKDETKKVTDVFTPKMLKKVQKFCVDHAADSEQPMTCG